MADFINQEVEIQEKVVYINRVAKVVKGGRRFRLTALVVVGDGQGRAGYGMGKANEVPSAISKAVTRAKKNMVDIPLRGTTITHQIVGEFGAGRVLLKPAVAGTGIIAGGPVRAIMDVAGVKDILAKSLGTSNPINMIRATFDGLLNLREAKEVAALRDVKIEDLIPYSSKKEEDTPTPVKEEK